MRVATGIIGKDITISNIFDFIHDRKLLISSAGGSLFEGWAIHDLIKGKVDEVGVVGICASAATIVLLAAPLRWGTQNSRFMIHNPWTEQQGNATAMQRTADELMNEQKILLSKYTQITGINSERLQAVMDKEIYLTPEEAQTLNLISIIKSEIMDLTEIDKKFNFIEKALNGLVKKFIIKNMIVQTVNGDELDFGEAITDVTQIKVGDKATVNGTPCAGKYVLADGTTLVFENGVITEIMKEVEDSMKKENEALKTENENLKTEIENLKKDHEVFAQKYKSEIDNVLKDFQAFKKSFSNAKVEPNTPAVVEQVTNRSVYKKK